MPALGADMETGKVVQWLVEPGSRVKPGDVVAVVETHKGAIDVEIFLEGVIEGLAPTGEELPVGAVLAHVRSQDEPRPVAAPKVQTGAAAIPIPADAAAARAKVSPAARRRARELGIDADRLLGSGIDRSVTLADVERAASQPRPAGVRVASAAAAAPVETVATTVPATPAAPAARRGFDPAQMRQAIAVAMSRSKREIPHYYLAETIDLDAASRWLEAGNAGRPAEDRILPAVLLLKATALAVKEVPQLNGFHVDGAYRPSEAIHIGWAIALRGGGLVAPAIHHADRKTVPQLMVELRDLVQRARSGGIRSSELTDPTITITSLGDRGVDAVLGVIHPPQVAMVGFGRVALRPWVVGGGIMPRPLTQVSLAADHRVSDGHLGSRFLTAIGRALQAPETL